MASTSARQVAAMLATRVSLLLFAVLGAAVVAWSAHRWKAGTGDLRAALDAGRTSITPARI
ncbi:hypothetical protein [Massilia sp. TSP1-1-2]|uniref:hypothetical protein n=1 Tax=unclassified Massilia TaxID=2609279 RepID=UPI003CF1523B